MTKKQMIRTRVTDSDVSLYDLEGPIDSAINHLVQVKQKFPDKQLELSVKSDPYDEWPSIYLYEQREETDAEYARRKAEAKSEAKAAEERQRRMYEKLKKKFGDS